MPIPFSKIQTNNMSHFSWLSKYFHQNFFRYKLLFQKLICHARGYMWLYIHCITFSFDIFFNSFLFARRSYFICTWENSEWSCRRSVNRYQISLHHLKKYWKLMRYSFWLNSRNLVRKFAITLHMTIWLSPLASIDSFKIQRHQRLRRQDPEKKKGRIYLLSLSFIYFSLFI